MFTNRWMLVIPWLMPMAVATVLFGTIYVVAQQLDRSQANDDPLRLASQVASDIRDGQTATISAQPHVDLSRSLASWVVVENAQGVATSGSGFLHGNLVSLPTGVLSNAAKSGEDNVTWQPSGDLRFATVTLKVGDQFVSAGQSLSPSENRLNNLQLLIGFGWLVAMLVIGGCWFWISRVRRAMQRESARQSHVPRSSE